MVYFTHVGSAHYKEFQVSKTMIAIMGSGPLGLWTADALVGEANSADIFLRIGNTRGKAPMWLPANLARSVAAGLVEWKAIDALDAGSVREFAAGSKALVHCVNPLYHEWASKLPIIQGNAIAAALAAKVRLICADNLYSYAAPVHGPLTEAQPENPPSRKGGIRRDMHGLLRQSQAAAGLAWATVQASDYFGPGAGSQSFFGDRFIDPTLQGKQAQFIGNPNLRHSWAYAPDFGRALALLATTQQESLLNRYWILPHVSHQPAAIMAQAFFKELDQQGILPATSSRTTGRLPRWLLRFASLFNPFIREVDEMLYQFLMDFEASGAAFSLASGLQPTKLETAIAETVDFWKQTKLH